MEDAVSRIFNDALHIAERGICIEWLHSHAYALQAAGSARPFFLRRAGFQEAQAEL